MKYVLISQLPKLFSLSFTQLLVSNDVCVLTSYPFQESCMSTDISQDFFSNCYSICFQQTPTMKAIERQNSGRNIGQLVCHTHTPYSTPFWFKCNNMSSNKNSQHRVGNDSNHCQVAACKASDLLAVYYCFNLTDGILKHFKRFHVKMRARRKRIERSAVKGERRVKKRVTRADSVEDRSREKNR